MLAPAVLGGHGRPQMWFLVFSQPAPAFIREYNRRGSTATGRQRATTKTKRRRSLARKHTTKWRTGGTGGTGGGHRKHRGSRPCLHPKNAGHLPTQDRGSLSYPLTGSTSSPGAPPSCPFTSATHLELPDARQHKNLNWGASVAPHTCIRGRPPPGHVRCRNS